MVRVGKEKAMLVQSRFARKTDYGLQGERIFQIRLIEPDCSDHPAVVLYKCLGYGTAAPKRGGLNFDNFSLQGNYFSRLFDIFRRHLTAVVLIAVREVPEQVFDGLNA